SQTVTGADGTMTVNDSATSPTNTINWNAGGSEVESFTFSGGALTQETDTGHAGSNGTGAVTFSQTTTFGSGSNTASISGTGEISGVSNATVTLVAGASATLLGSHDTVTAAGASTTVALGGTAANDAVAISGANSILTDAGTNNATTTSGANDAV